MAKTRTFIAIDSDAALQRRAGGVIDRLQPYAPGARWIEEEDLHLTLLFLGDLSDAEIAETCSGAEWVAKANAPFRLRVQGVGAFPDVARPRAVWLGTGEGREAVCRLQTDLDDALAHLIVRPEKRGFVPHWTLARLGRRQDRVSDNLAETLAGLADHDTGELSVAEIVVFASELRPAGPEYYSLARCRLGLGGG